MAPTDPNRPRLRHFSFPVGKAIASALFLGSLYYLSHTPAGQYKVAGIDIPLTGIPRTLVAYFLYSIFPVHIYEASVAYKLTTEHRASPLHVLLYTSTVFIFGVLVLDNLKHVIQVAKKDAITGKKK